MVPITKTCRANHARRRPWLTTAAVALCCLAAARPLPAQTVTYVSQERSVAASIRDEFRVGDPPEWVTVSDQESAAAPDSGPFDARVSAQKTEPFQTGYGAISQRSVLAPDGITATGDWAGWVATDNGTYGFSTLVAATFDVTGAPARYDLTYRLDEPNPLPGRHDVNLLLRRADGGGDVFVVIPDYAPDDYTATGALSGTLPPGRYEFRYSDSVRNDPGDRGTYDVSLRFSPVPEPAATLVLPASAALLALRRQRRLQ